MDEIELEYLARKEFVKMGDLYTPNDELEIMFDNNSFCLDYISSNYTDSNFEGQVSKSINRIKAYYFKDKPFIQIVSLFVNPNFRRTKRYFGTKMVNSVENFGIRLGYLHSFLNDPSDSSLKFWNNRHYKPHHLGTNLWGKKLV